MALTTTTVQIKTGSGAPANVAAVTDGTNVYLLHGSVDANGNLITPAQDSTMQQATHCAASLAMSEKAQPPKPSSIIALIDGSVAKVRFRGRVHKCRTR